MDCPNCGARLVQDQGLDSWTCIYCRNAYRGEKNEDNVCLTGEVSKLSCPVCAVPLAEATMEGRHLAYCTRCRGLLIAVEIFVSLLDELRAKQAGAWHIAPPPDPKELERRIHCPRCARLMDTHFYGGPGNVIVDDCAACELNWFDKGELTRIVRAPQEFSY